MFKESFDFSVEVDKVLLGKITACGRRVLHKFIITLPVRRGHSLLS